MYLQFVVESREKAVDRHRTMALENVQMSQNNDDLKVSVELFGLTKTI